MTYVVVVYGNPEPTLRPPTVVGPFDTGLQAADFAGQLPQWQRWHTLYANEPDGTVANYILHSDEPDSDEIDSEES